MGKIEMSKIGICIEPVFVSLSYPDRVRKIAALGFKNYEFWSPDNSLTDKGMIRESKDLDLLGALNDELGLSVTDILYNPGEEGANLIRREDKGKLVDNFGAFAEAAKKIRCGACIVTGGVLIPGQSRDESLLNLADNLRALLGEAEKNGMTLLLEPLNSKFDHRDTFLDDPLLTVRVVQFLNNPRMKILYDIYHMQIMGGNILSFLQENLEYIGHFHIAGVPGRHEPYSGEVDYAHIVRELSAMGYTGCFGLEYWPREAAEISLRTSLEYLSPPA
jgi:hydroxypyruvate isomerase